MNINLGISTCYDSGMNTTTNHHQVICTCGYKSRQYINESKAWSIRDNHLWNIHNEFARSNRANVISQLIKKVGA